MSGGVCIFSKKNKQQLTSSWDVAVIGIASYFNATQAGARAEGQTDADGHGRTRTDVVGDNGKVVWEVGGDGKPLYEAMMCFRGPIVDVCVHALDNRDATHENAHGVTRGRARRNKPCANSPQTLSTDEKQCRFRLDVTTSFLAG